MPVAVPFSPDLTIQAIRRNGEEAVVFVPTLVESVSIAAGDTQIPHGLGRRWSGYVVTRIRSGTPAVIQDASAQTDATLFVSVTSASAFVADLWVF